MFVQGTLLRSGSKPLKTPSVLLLLSLSCGGQDYPDGVVEGSNGTKGSYRKLVVEDYFHRQAMFVSE